MSHPPPPSDPAMHGRNLLSQFMILPLLDCPSSYSSAHSFIVRFKPMQFCWFLNACNRLSPTTWGTAMEQSLAGCFYLYVRETLDTEEVIAALKKRLFWWSRRVACSEDWFWNTDSLNLRKWTAGIWSIVRSFHFFNTWRCFTYLVHAKDTESEENTQRH